MLGGEGHSRKVELYGHMSILLIWVSLRSSCVLYSSFNTRRTGQYIILTCHFSPCHSLPIPICQVLQSFLSSFSPDGARGCPSFLLPGHILSEIRALSREGCTVTIYYSVSPSVCKYCETKIMVTLFTLLQGLAGCLKS